ncbi:MAG: 2-hydroxyglutaryl-CoA dehydratase [Gemmatimonadetes bacterium]|nr:2-hydroxyglutaryl-CoA dehydratase [Gemmatimonadota bacterium]
MTYVLGLDVGSRTTKGVLLGNGTHSLARASIMTGALFQDAAAKVRDMCCTAALIDPEEVGYVASTGYGRYQVAFRQVQITEITCHARGALALFPQTRTVIDCGAQNTRTMRVGPDGRVLAFRVNDKCASGAGRFLERVAKALELHLAELGPRALMSKNPCEISSICAVLAESEVINLVSQEQPTEDILAGAHRAIVGRVLSLVRMLKFEPEVTVTGGVVHNPAFVQVLREGLGVDVNVGADNEYAGAMGAALLGLLRLERAAA